MPKISRPIPITLDRARTLRIDFNATCSIEEATKCNVLMPDFWRDVGPTKIRAALWGALLHEDPSLKLDQVGAIIDEHFDKFDVICDALMEAYRESLPKPKEEPNAS